MRTRGFTLIELLVVVAIIALLIAILLPSLGLAKRVALRTTCGAQLQGIGRALAAYGSEFGELPKCNTGYYNSGFQGSQWLAFRSQSTWKPDSNGMFVPHGVRAYTGGSAAFVKIWACPAVPNATNVFAMPEQNQPGQPGWYQPRLELNKFGSNYLGTNSIYAYTNYWYFTGDPGNSDGVHLYYFSTASTSAGDPLYSGLDHPNGNSRIASIVPSDLLMQDNLRKDPTTGYFKANHVRSGTEVANTFAITSNHRYYQGYFLTDREDAAEGANVLLGDFHVEFRKTSELTKVYHPDGGVSVLYLGSRPQ